MRPILFSESETDFSSNGLGRLDCISCYVEEERNGAYELEAVVSETGLHTSEIKPSTIILAKHDDSEDLQPFRVYEVRRPIDGKVAVYAQHISYQLSYIPVMPFQVYASAGACAETLSKLKSNAVEACPFAFETDVTTVSSYTQNTPASLRQRLGGISGSVLDQFGGEYEWDKWKVILHKSRGVTTPTVSLRYGKNIIDLQQEQNISNTVTGVVPFWVSTDGKETVILPERVIESQYASNYPFKRTIPLDLSSEFTEKPTEEQLRAMARVRVNKTGVGLPKVSIDVSFTQLWQTEEYKDVAPLQHVKLCDYVNIEFDRLGITEAAKVVKTRYDVLNERYESMELGEARSTLAQTITDISGAIEAETDRNIFAVRNMSQTLRGEITEATAWLTGSNGYVMAVKNPDGSWKELLFLDAPSAEEAIRVLRINENGIGFSSNGIGGPYTQAWTLDGKIVIGGTNVPSLTVYHSNGTVLFQVTAGGMEWTLPNSTMTKAGIVTLKGATISGSFLAASTDGKVTFYAGNDGFKWTAPNSSMTVDGTLTIKEAIISSTKKDGNKTYQTTIRDGTITTNSIKATDGTFSGTISAAKISMSEFSAGTLSGNEIIGGTITGSTIISENGGNKTTISGDTIISEGSDGMYTAIAAGALVSNDIILIGQADDPYPSLQFKASADSPTKGFIFIPPGMVADNRPIIQAIGHLEVVSAGDSVIESGFIADSGRIYSGGAIWSRGDVKPSVNEGANLGISSQRWNNIRGKNIYCDNLDVDTKIDAADISATEIMPNVSGAELGDTGKRWEIYGTSGNFSGKVTAKNFENSNGVTFNDLVERVKALEDK